MNPRDDRRGVSTVVGAVLIFGIVVVLLSLYQAQAVPAQNKNVEFQHTQAVQTDMLHVRDGLLRTAASGNPYPTSVALGTRYPSRIFFVNPPPVSGRLSTESVGPGAVAIANVRALDDETADYWDGSTHTFDSKSLAYEAEYTYRQQSPVVTYENSLLYDRYPDRGVTVVDAGPTVVDGNTLTLVALTGNLSRNGVSATSVDPRPASAPYHEVTVESSVSQAGPENVVVTLPTRLSASKWKELLADELDPDGKDDDADDGYVLDVRPSGANAVEIILEPDTYTLRLANVGVGTGVEQPSAHYATAVYGHHHTVREGSTQKLVAQVRDRYNNPVPGTPLDVTVYGNGTATPTTVRTGDDGRATVLYEAAQDDDATDETIQVVTAFGEYDRQTASFTVYVADDESSNDTTTSQAPAIDRFTVVDNSKNGDALFDVNWSVSDANGDLDTVTVELRRSTNNKLVASETITVTGGTATGRTSLTYKGGQGNTYDIVLKVTDAAGNTAQETKTETADGS